MPSSKCQSPLHFIRKFAIPFYENASPTHDWSHIERVRRLSVKIGKSEGAELSVLSAAALLHDLARDSKVPSSTDHAELSAKKARRILVAAGFPPDKIKLVVHCVRAHRFRTKTKPRSLEAMILSDADKLDAIGAVGIARLFTYAGEHGKALYPYKSTLPLAATSLGEFEFKLKRIWRRLYTKSARAMAKQRHRFMIDFFRGFRQEIRGVYSPCSSVDLNISPHIALKTSPTRPRIIHRP